MLYVIDAIA